MLLHGLDMTLQFVEGIHALHRLGYIHGDIKEDNIFLLEGGAVVLGDLGMAVAAQEAMASTRGAKRTAASRCVRAVRFWCGLHVGAGAM
jgi:serine/threonine protein kinase